MWLFIALCYEMKMIWILGILRSPIKLQCSIIKVVIVCGQIEISKIVSGQQTYKIVVVIEWSLKIESGYM